MFSVFHSVITLPANLASFLANFCLFFSATILSDDHFCFSPPPHHLLEHIAAVCPFDKFQTLSTFDLQHIFSTSKAELDL